MMIFISRRYKTGDGSLSCFYHCFVVFVLAFAIDAFKVHKDIKYINEHVRKTEKSDELL